MEHIPSDIENIKVSLTGASDYIINKSVDRGQVNNFDNLKDVSKVVWDLISTIYKARWDVLYIKDNIFLGIRWHQNLHQKLTIC